MRINVTQLSTDIVFKVAFGEVVNCSANSLRLPVLQWTPVKPKAANNTLRDKTGPTWALLRISIPGSVMWSCSASTDRDVPPELKVAFTFSGLNIDFSHNSIVVFNYLIKKKEKIIISQGDSLTNTSPSI